MIATCLMPTYQSHAQAHACLAHVPVAEWINLALRECVFVLSGPVVGFFFIPYVAKRRRVVLWHAGGSGRRLWVGSYIYQVVVEALEGNLSISRISSSRRGLRAHILNSPLRTWRTVPWTAILQICLSELTEKHRLELRLCKYF